MATGGGKAPLHLPSLSLSSPSSTPHLGLTAGSGSLQTPDTSTIFVSNLSSGGQSQSFTSLEDILDATGITQEAENHEVDPLPHESPTMADLTPPAKRARHNSDTSRRINSVPAGISPVLLSGPGSDQSSAASTHSTVSLFQTNPSHSPTICTANKPLSFSTPLNGPLPMRTQFTGNVPPTVSLSVPASSPTVSVTVPSVEAPSKAVIPKDFVVQLVQLYKQYQALGDAQGAERVHQQLNVLAAAQRKLQAGQNTGTSPDRGSIVRTCAPVQPVAGSGLRTTVGQTMRVTTLPSPQPSPTVSLSSQHVHASPLGIKPTAGVAAGNPLLTASVSPAPSLVTSLYRTPSLPATPPSLPTSLPSLPPSLPSLPPSLPSLPPSLPAPPPSLPSPSPSLPAPSPSLPALPPSLSAPPPSLSAPPPSLPAPPPSLPAPPPSLSIPPPSLSAPPPSLPAAPPSLPQQVKKIMANSSSLHPNTASSTQNTDQIKQASNSQEVKASALRSAVFNFRLRQLQSFVQTLPVDQRPKTMDEIKDLIQKHNVRFQGLPSTLTSFIQDPNPSIKGGLSAATTLSSSSPSIPPVTNPPTYNTFRSMPSATTQVLSKPPAGGLHSIVSIPSLPSSTETTSTLAPTARTQVLSSTDVLGTRSLAPYSQTGVSSLASSFLGTGRSNMVATSAFSGAAGGLATLKASVVPSVGHNLVGTQSFKPVIGTVHAPLTSQFGTSRPAVTHQMAPGATAPSPLVTAQNNHAIQPGVPTPLPPELTPEKLGVLCRLPESELTKLRLPLGLLTAIQVWKAQQPGINSQRISVSSQSGALSDIPVIVPPSTSFLPSISLPSSVSLPPSTTLPSAISLPPSTSLQPPTSLPSSISLPSSTSLPSSNSLLPSTSLPSAVPSLSLGQAALLTRHGGISRHQQVQFSVGGSEQCAERGTMAPTSVAADLPMKLTNTAQQSGTDEAMQVRPVLIPVSQGFPPRSLHPVYHVPTSSVQRAPQPPFSMPSQHMTRARVRMEQQKAEHDKMQALTKALQSSEEARTAFRFSAHLEKMHSQLLQPDVVTPFRSQQDVLARLLPYHIWAEPEPPPAAIEKADAVFESVASVLLSRSRGLMARFQQVTTRDEQEGNEGGMQMCLDRLFLEAEEERVEQENRERQQAEQVAADLSLMAVDGARAYFDSEFSFGELMVEADPLGTGIT